MVGQGLPASELSMVGQWLPVSGIGKVVQWLLVSVFTLESFLILLFPLAASNKSKCTH